MCRLLGFVVGVAFQVGIYGTAASNGWQIDPNFMVFLFVCGIANVVLITQIFICKCCMGVAGIDILYRYKVLNLLACLGGESQTTYTKQVITWSDGTTTEKEDNDGCLTMICDIIMGGITSLLSPILVVLVLLSMLNYFFCNCCKQSPDAVLRESTLIQE